MKPDDEICYCFHVSLRKLATFSRRERPRHPSQMTECLSAGTGCGWCIPFLVKISKDPEAFAQSDLSPEEYAAKRQGYIANRGEKNTFQNATVAESDQASSAEADDDR